MGVWGAAAAAAGSPPAASLAWPPPPADPHIIYVRDIATSRDIGVKSPFFTRLASHITGVSSDAKSLSRPFGLSLDEAGNLVVTDTGASTVNYLDIAHHKWQTWRGAGDRRFVSPVAAVHRGRLFYVADSGLGVVLAFDEQGRRQFEITNQLARPSGIAVQGGHLLVADAELHHVVVCSLQGEFVSEFGQRGDGDGQFNFPTHIGVDSRNQVYVTDSLNCRIQVFTAEGRFLRTFGSVGDGPGRFSRPKGVAVDGAGHVYVVDAVFGNVQIFNEQGRLLLDFGTDGTAAGQFSLPNGIAINASNEIFVADAYNHRLQMFRYTGRQ